MEKTLRDEFAMAAMQGLVSDTNYDPCAAGKSYRECVAEYAYDIADAMIKVRESSLRK